MSPQLLYQRSMHYDMPFENRSITKEDKSKNTKEDKSKKDYHFKGDLNYEILQSDCFEDGKKAFVLVCPDCCKVGILKNISPEYVFCLEKKYNIRLLHSIESRTYFIFTLKKEQTSLAIQVAKDAVKLMKASVKKKKKEINKKKKKGEFTKKPVTKVMVF